MSQPNIWDNEPSPAMDWRTPTTTPERTISSFTDEEVAKLALFVLSLTEDDVERCLSYTALRVCGTDVGAHVTDMVNRVKREANVPSRGPKSNWHLAVNKLVTVALPLAQLVQLARLSNDGDVKASKIMPDIGHDGVIPSDDVIRIILNAYWKDLKQKHLPPS